MKKVLSLLLIVAMMFSVFAFSVYAINDYEMSIYFIDCGQGDAIFISSKGESMLMDAGKASNVHNVLNFLDNQDIEEIDYVFSSHPDEDHIGGMPEVYKSYQVNNSFYSSYVANTNIYQKYMEAVKNEPNSYFSIVNENDIFTLGDAEIDVLSDGKNYSNSNDASLVLRVTCGEQSLLLTGDISKTVEQDLVDSDKNIDVDILKVAHHGSASSSSLNFLLEVSPDVSVISVGEGNSYGHPTQEALDRLSSVSDNVYRTDKEGTILLKVNQNGITYNGNIIDTSDPSYGTEKTVYVTSGGKKYHASSICSNMKNPIPKTLAEAKEAGYTACSKCVSDDFETGNSPQVTKSFSDVKSSDWFKYYVDYAVANGMFKGTSDTTFSPNTDMTRAQFVQVLANLSGVALNNNVNSGFNDVPTGAWFTGAVKWAVDNGVASGIGNGKFDPNAKVTREQMCVMLVNYVENYLGKSLKVTTASSTIADDNNISTWAKDAVYKCYKAGLVSGTGNNMFSPKVVANRAQGATIFTNFHIAYIA